MILSIVISFLSLLGSGNSQANGNCGNWTDFKNEKCFMLFDHVASFNDALAFCQKLDQESSLVIIKTLDEQVAIAKILKDSNYANNIWIGLSKKDGTFKNLDKTNLLFENWDKNRPLTNKTNIDCVEMSTDDANFGKWIDEKCLKMNGIMCEKIQLLSTISLQKILLDLRREHESRLVHLEDNPVPIGFIYVQIFGQSDPKSLWPKTQWENISGKYAGLFFRTEGGQAAPFGQIQEQQTWGLDVDSGDLKPYAPGDDWRKHMGTHKVGTTFDFRFFTGSIDGFDVGLTFRQVTNDNRPKNSAIKIWQRIK